MNSFKAFHFIVGSVLFYAIFSSKPINLDRFVIGNFEQFVRRQRYSLLHKNTKRVPCCIMKLQTHILIFCVCGTFICYILLFPFNFPSNSTLSKSSIMQIILGSTNVEPKVSTYNMNFFVCNTTKTLATMEKLCEKEKCVEKFHETPKSRVIYVPQYNLANCGIPKSLSTIVETILCFLYDPDDFKSHSLTMTEGNYYQRICQGKLQHQKPDSDRMTSRNWTHMVVVRNPIDRLLSGFIDKCIGEKEGIVMRLKLKSENTTDFERRLRKLDEEWCLGCGYNLTCFVHKNYLKLLYSKDENEWFMYQDHFFPQTWYCSFSTYMEYYTILRLSTETKNMKDFYDAIVNILQSHQVPQELIDTIDVQIRTKRTDHATSGTNRSEFYRNWLYSDKELIRTVIKTYFYDFTIFGFEFPQL